MNQLMDRVQQAAILTKLVASLRSQGSWCGETHIQKAVFFLQELTRVPFGFHFVLYEYGPFSFELRDELAAMRADYLLDLEVFESYGPKYHATRRAIRLQDKFPKTLAHFGPRIRFVAENVGSSYVDRLERLSTAYYLKIKEKRESSFEERAKRLVEIKSHIPLDLAIKSVVEAENLCDDWCQSRGS